MRHLWTWDTSYHNKRAFSLWWNRQLKNFIAGRKVSLICRFYTVASKSTTEPSHEIMVLFVLHKLILQTRIHSHPVVGPFVYFMYANSEGSGETVRTRRLAWAVAGHLCNKYHSWLNFHLLLDPSSITIRKIGTAKKIAVRILNFGGWDFTVYSTGQGFFHQSARPRVQRGPMERIKILHPATVTPESAGTRCPCCIIDR